MRHYLYLILSVVVLASCSGQKKNANTSSELLADAYTVEYAKGFTVDRYKDYTIVSVRDLWDAEKILKTYILVPKDRELPNNLPNGVVVRTPLSKVVAYSMLHCSTLQEIGNLNTIVGVCEPQYIDIEYIQHKIEKGEIVDLGQASNPLIEKIIDIEPEAILATPIQGMTYGGVEKTKLPIIETPDYMEKHPLGRAEWIRFYSLFFEKEALADSLFNETAANYNRIKDRLASVDNRPTVFMDLMYQGVWNVSGGNSFISHMLRDAGGQYVWDGDGITSFTPMSFEQVLEKAGEADIWLVRYNQANDMTYAILEKEYKPYSYFEAFKKRNIYECNVGYKPYYADLPIHPDYVLEDFAYVFHPNLFPNYTPRYYTKMKE